MFDQLKLQDLDLHVKIVAWLSIIANALYLLIGVSVFFLLVGIGAVTGEVEAFGILGIVGTTVGAFLAVLGVPGVVAGIALLRRAGWGRVVALVLAAIGLLSFPVGTALGAYTFWVLLQRSADDYFSEPRLRAEP